VSIKFLDVETRVVPGQCSPLAVYLVEPTDFSHGRSLLNEFAANDTPSDFGLASLRCFGQSRERTYPALSARVLDRFRGLADCMNDASCHPGREKFQRVETRVVSQETRMMRDVVGACDSFSPSAFVTDAGSR
jgi:hypothetical protein